MIVSICAFGLSAIFGFWCALNRLTDFRGTARRACNHEKAPMKDDLRELGDRTWLLFYVEVGTFVLGIAALGLVLLLSYGDMLISSAGHPLVVSYFHFLTRLSLYVMVTNLPCLVHIAVPRLTLITTLRPKSLIVRLMRSPYAMSFLSIAS